MPLDLRLTRTPTGKPQLIDPAPCRWDDFPARAQAILDHFTMTSSRQIDGLDERMWIAHLGDAEFCISWDTWSDEVSVMAWGRTPDAALQRLARPRG